MNSEYSLACGCCRTVNPYCICLIHPHSVVDVGCGSGSWLSVFKSKYGCSVLGIDGEYVDLQDTFLSQSEFLSHNLEKNGFVW